MKNDINFLFEIDELSRVFRAKLDREFQSSSVPVSYQKYLVLREIKANITMQKLAKKTYRDKSRIKKTIDELKKEKLIWKIMDSNQKSYGLILSETGQKAVRKGDKIVEKARSEVFKFISPAEAKLISRIRKKLPEND